MDVKRVNTKIKSFTTKTKLNQTAKKLEKARLERRRAKTERQKFGGNPITRKLAQRREKSIKKHEVKMRKLEAEAQLAEQNPKLTVKKAETDNAIAIEKAKFRNKTASSTALAAGAATLGRGLSDERNQDDEKDRQLELEKIKTIFGSSSGSRDNTDNADENGLSQGVY